MVNKLYKKIMVRKRLTDEYTWDTVANAIEIPDASDFKVSKVIGKKKNTFTFKVHNYNKHLFETFHNGTGSETGFTLKYSPIHSSYLGTERFEVAEYTGGAWITKTHPTDYTVSGSTITFTSAPASGIKNIRVRFPLLETDDLIRIYQWKNSTWAELTTTEQNNAIKIEGVIIEPNSKTDDSGKIFTVRGNGLIDIIFKGLVFVKPSTGKTTADQYIQDIIAQLNEYNQDRTIYGENSTEWSDIGNSTTTKSIEYNSSYKTAVEQIEDLSSDDYTGDGQYIYWVEYDGTNDRFNFIWKTKPTDTTNIIVEGSQPTQIKAEKDVDEVVNACIYNCGLDCNGNGMEFFYYDASAGYGSRWLYVTKTNTIGENLVNKEFEADSTLWQTGNDGERVSNSDNNYNANYPTNAEIATWTFQFEGRNADGSKTGSAAVATDQDEFNEAIRKESEFAGKAVAKKIVDLHNDPRYKVKTEIPFGPYTTYELGNMDEHTIPSFGVYNKKLRIHQIDYSFWTIDIEYEEDENTAVES